MKRALAVLAVLAMSSVIARGMTYIFQDDVMNHRFWVSTTGTQYRFGNQLLLPAVITDLQNNVLTTDAMVIYDTVYGNLNLMHYGNYCIYTWDWPHNTGHAVIAQTGQDPDNVWAGEDWLYLVGSYITESELTDSGAATGEALGSDPVVMLGTSFGDYYYLYDCYRIGDPNFKFYAYTMVAETYGGYADALLFYQLINRWDGETIYKVIINVFATSSNYAYSMAGIYYPFESSARYHAFSVIGNGIMTTATVY